MNAIGDDLLTPEELAGKLKKSVSSIYRMQADGEIPGRLVRGALRFVYAEVLRALPIAPTVAMKRGVDRPYLVDVGALKQLVKTMRRAG